jgi:hypothetical protein
MSARRATPSALCALPARDTANRGRRTVITAIERLQRWEAQSQLPRLSGVFAERG